MDSSNDTRTPELVVPDRLNRVRYALYAPIYDCLVEIFSRSRREAIEALGLRPRQRVLIVGCGTGLDLDSIPLGVLVTGIDLTPGMITRAEARAKRLGIRAIFR